MIKFNDYEVVYNYNCFCDTDLLDRVSAIVNLFDEEVDASGAFGSYKDLFVTVRSLLFVGLQKKHSDVIKTEQDAGNLIDDLVEENEITVYEIFEKIMEELTEKGFLSSILGEEETEKELPKPQDHKKSTKK